jgi:hypothetical protein
VRATAAGDPRSLGVDVRPLAGARRDARGRHVDVGLGHDARFLGSRWISAQRATRCACWVSWWPRTPTSGGLLAVAKRRATSTAPPHRRARWAALAAYLDAGVPDPGVPPEAGLARALGADAASARWALGLIPNELEEHAPRPFPYVRDVALTKAIAARSEAVETDEDTVLALDASSLAAPGTGLALAVRATSSPQPGVQRAAMAALTRQIQQLDGSGRAHALFAPHMADLRRGLVSRVCTSTEVLSFLAAAGDDALDTEASSCLTSNPDPGTSYLHELFGQCMAREFGMSKTASALEAIAKPGEEGDYTRRVARGCKTGKN